MNNMAEQIGAGNVSNIQFETSEEVEVVPTFDLLCLKDELLQGIYAKGFQQPSEIQKRALLPMIRGRDVITKAQSGTGKTIAYCISILQMLELEVNPDGPQVLCLTPTPELAVQVQRAILALGAFMKLSVYACVAGVNHCEDINKYFDADPVITGTPGHVLNLLKSRVFRTESVKMLVLDEADEMLKLGFKGQINEVFRYLSPATQVIMISATFPQEIGEIISKFMKAPIRISVKLDELTMDGMKQFFIGFERKEWKFDTLCDFYPTLSVKQAIIFCNTQENVNFLTEKMLEHNFVVGSMHGDMSQRERDLIMLEFRSGNCRILITTDKWTRGIDVQHAPLVINYELTPSPDMYIHRIGRSGRFDSFGFAINFIAPDEIRILREIEQYYAIQIDEMQMNITDLFQI